MVRAIERDEALGMLGGLEDACGMVDSDHRVQRGVHDEEGSAERADAIGQPVSFSVLNEGAPDSELAAGKLYLRLARRADLIERAAEVREHMTDVGGRSDGDDRLRLGNGGCRGQHGSTPKRVADQDGRRGVIVAQVVGCADEILDVGGKVGIRELSLRRSKAGEIEAQHAEAVRRQGGGDTPRGQDVFGAGEAMREKHKRAHGTGGEIQAGAEVDAGTSLENRAQDGARRGRHHRYLPRMNFETLP